MKAFIYVLNKDGRRIPGTEWADVSRECQTQKQLIKRDVMAWLRKAVKNKFSNRVRVEIHNNWDTRYDTCDKAIVVEAVNFDLGNIVITEVECES